MSKKYIDLVNYTNYWIFDNSTKNVIAQLTKRRKELITGDINIEELIQQYKENPNDETMEIIILYNLPMAVILVKNYAYLVDEQNVSDLFAVALETIVRSVEKYDASRNNKFSSYLVINMKGEILKAIDQMRVIKFTYYHHVTKNKNNKKIEELDCYIETNPDDLELSWPVITVGEQDISTIMNEPYSNEILESYVYHKSSDYIINFYNERDRDIRSRVIRKAVEDCYGEFIIDCNIIDEEKKYTDYLFECLMNNIKRPMIIKKHREYKITKRQAYGLSHKMNHYIKECIKNKARVNDELMEILKELYISEKSEG